MKENIVGIIIFLATVVVILTLLIVRQVIISKKEKKLINELKIGSYIITVSGICGKIIGMKVVEDFSYVLLQTGDTTHKSYLTVDKECIYDIVKDPIDILNDEIKVNDSKINENKQEN